MSGPTPGAGEGAGSPPSREGLTDDDIVAAFLLEVKEIKKKPEEGRAREWRGIDELRSKLAQRRLRHYVREIEPVINAAARATERG